MMASEEVMSSQHARCSSFVPSLLWLTDLDALCEIGPVQNGVEMSRPDDYSPLCKETLH